jgi:hypothetical protein
MQAKTGGLYTALLVAATDTVVLPGSLKRCYIVLSPATGADVWYSNKVMTAEGQGIKLASTARPLVLSRDEIGDAIIAPWHAFCLAAPTITLLSGEGE